jgi:aspartyl-tRNA(Asn)/glutamyl-tRNA(Gln) amidotransferase subunit C
MIGGKDLEHIAWLARIELREEDRELYTSRLSSVLDYFGQVDEVDTREVEPTYHVLELNNIFRDDEINTPAKSISQEEALSNAPKKQDGFFKAPRMM